MKGRQNGLASRREDALAVLTGAPEFIGYVEVVFLARAFKVHSYDLGDKITCDAEVHAISVNVPWPPEEGAGSVSNRSWRRR
jgi:hypothetical protein